ncbi:hypothetical protein M0811_02308 [Anaeramoeba ignava]|uniref:BTB domain-containing protein n=1 Tax=Anaeramoeba ignava TaxID=1746090 RepID=A0A9Q0R7P8_ANAIG|nr:hypothetical protein M0811_02308 [Anaeramoeba ignava]
MFLNCHKSILRARCKKWEQMPYIAMLMTEKALQALKDYLYTGLYDPAKINEEDKKSLVSACEKLELQELLDLCEGKSVDTYRTLVDDFERLYKTSEGADFEIIVGDEKIPCHKAILAARSQLYLGMFTSVSDPSNSVPDFSGRSAESIRALLLYLYTDKTDHINYEIAKELIEASSFYGLYNHTLDEVCEKIILNHESQEKK